jgi:hypothetical protein
VFRPGRAFPHEPLDLGINQIARFGRRRFSTSVTAATGHMCDALRLLTELLNNYRTLHALVVTSEHEKTKDNTDTMSFASRTANCLDVYEVLLSRSPAN